MKEVFVAPVHPPLALHDEGVPLDIILFVGAHGNGGGRRDVDERQGDAGTTHVLV